MSFTSAHGYGITLGALAGGLAGAVEAHRSGAGRGDVLLLALAGAVAGGVIGGGTDAIVQSQLPAASGPPVPPVPFGGGAPARAQARVEQYMGENFYAYFQLDPGCIWQFLTQNFYEKDVAEIYASTHLRPIGVWRYDMMALTWQWYVVDQWRGAECWHR